MNTKPEQTRTNHNKLKLISFVVVALSLASCVGNNTNQPNQSNGNNKTTAKTSSNQTNNTNTRLIFVTERTTTGNIKQTAINYGAPESTTLTGIDGADYICSHDTKCLTGDCRAMLNDNQNRISPLLKSDGTYNSGKNWVLESYTSYYNISKSLVGTTDSSPVLNPGQPLSSPISTDNYTVFTGMNGNSTPFDTYLETCGQWTIVKSDNGVIYSDTGNSNDTYQGYLSYRANLCSTNQRLYCVTYQHPQINITTSGLFSGNTAQTGQSFTVTATLSAGYNVAKQNITLDNLSPASSSIIFTNNQCSISSQNESCTITVNIESSTTPESYTLSVTNQTSGGIKPSTSRISFNVQPWKFIFVTEGSFTGDLTHGGGVTNESFANGIIAADAYCMRDPQSNFPPGATYKAMIADGINRTVLPNAVDWVLAPGSMLTSFLYNPVKPGTNLSFSVIAAVNADGTPGRAIGNSFFIPPQQASNATWTGLVHNGVDVGPQFCGVSWNTANFLDGGIGWPGGTAIVQRPITWYDIRIAVGSCEARNALYCVQQ